MNDAAHRAVPCGTADVGIAEEAALGEALAGISCDPFSALLGGGDDAAGEEHAQISATSRSFDIPLTEECLAVPSPASALEAITLTRGL